MRLAKKLSRIKEGSNEYRFIAKYFQGKTPSLKNIFNEIQRLGAIDYPSHSFRAQEVAGSVQNVPIKEWCS